MTHNYYYFSTITTTTTTTTTLSTRNKRSISPVMRATSSELINYSTRVVFHYFSLLFTMFYYYILISFTLFSDNECLCCRFISSLSSTNVSYQLSHSISNLHSTAPILSLSFIITSISLLLM